MNIDIFGKTEHDKETKLQQVSNFYSKNEDSIKEYAKNCEKQDEQKKKVDEAILNTSESNKKQVELLKEQITTQETQIDKLQEMYNLLSEGSKEMKNESSRSKFRSWFSIGIALVSLICALLALLLEFKVW